MTKMVVETQVQKIKAGQDTDDDNDGEMMLMMIVRRVANGIQRTSNLNKTATLSRR